jgi:hypothetical protein
VISMGEQTAVDRLYSEANSVILLLQSSSEFSLQVAAADHFRKALLLAAASYFEDRVCNCVIEHVRLRAKGSRLVENFVINKAVARQYHTWFAWKESNANSFFGLFGAEFGTSMTARVRASPDLEESIKAFLELGNERNRLVHQNYATFQMEKTLDEVYALYKSSSVFVDVLPAVFSEGENDASDSI